MKRGHYVLRFVQHLRRHSYGLLVLGYLSTLTAFSWYAGDIWNPTTVFFLLAMALLGFLGLGMPWTRPWVALATIGLSFQVISGPVDALGDSGGALSFLDLDKYVWGFNLTAWTQTAFSSALTTEATSFVYATLIPFVLGTSFAIWRYRRASFARFVTAMVLTSYAALLTFVLMPTAPPWFSGAASDLFHGLGVGAVSGFLAPLSTLIVPDYFAAFPSLHAAYTITCCYFLFKVDYRLGLIGGLMAGATLFSTIYLGQHYAIDLIGGAVYSLVPCWVAGRSSSIQTAMMRPS
jgi:membrane-associated phospholipid phosphatase